MISKLELRDRIQTSRSAKRLAEMLMNRIENKEIILRQALEACRKCVNPETGERAAFLLKKAVLTKIMG